jgi:hypothetical protein
MRIDPDRWRELQTLFESFIGTEPYKRFEADAVSFVRAPATDEPFLVPYLPFVGPRYDGLLVYSMAQQVTGGDIGTWWPTCMGKGSESVRRLYPGSGQDTFGQGPLSACVVDRHRIPIQPISDGPLLAVAGLILRVTTGDNVSTLNNVLEHIACTNYYKFSLVRRSEKGRLNNQDPSRLGKTLVAEYARQMADDFCLPEIEVLKPRFVVAVTKAGPGILESIQGRKPGLRVIRVNDPSWILQGMSGVASPGGSWLNKVENGDIPDEVAHLIDGYARQCTGDYSHKREAVRVYLKKYWLDFSVAFDNTV